MEHDKSHEDLKDYFYVHILLLKIIGIPVKPMDENMNVVLKYLYYLYSVVFIITIPGGFLFMESYASIDNWGNIQKFSSGLSFSLTHLLGMMKIILFMVKRENIWRLCQSLESGFLKPNVERGGEKEYEYVRDAIKQTNAQASIFHIWVAACLLTRLAYVLVYNAELETTYDPITNNTISPERALPFLVWLPFDYNERPVYDYICVYTIVSPWIFGLYVGTLDLVITGFITHIKAQFLILKNCMRLYIQKGEDAYIREHGLPEFKALQRRNALKANENWEILPSLPKELQEYVTKYLIECVRHHHTILTFAAEVESVFTVLMLLQFLTSLIMVCFVLYQLSITTGGPLLFISTACYLILMTFQLLCYCWNGNDAILHSGTLSNAIFESNWVITDEPTKKLLLLMMMRAQRPTQFTASGFAILSYATFMSILKGSASYFMFLRQMSGSGSSAQEFLD